MGKSQLTEKLQAVKLSYCYLSRLHVEVPLDLRKTLSGMSYILY